MCDLIWHDIQDAGRAIEVFNETDELPEKGIEDGLMAFVDLRRNRFMLRVPLFP